MEHHFRLWHSALMNDTVKLFRKKLSTYCRKPPLRLDGANVGRADTNGVDSTDVDDCAETGVSRGQAPVSSGRALPVSSSTYVHEESFSYFKNRFFLAVCSFGARPSAMTQG